MPGRGRQAAARPAQSEADDGAYNIPGLEFNDALTWRAGRAIPVADLFIRLQALAEELRTLEQESVAKEDIKKLAQDLVHSNLLGHKDKGIRAWTVSCVVDVLNICAPDAPYKPAQLRDIFTVIVNTILPALADPSNAYNNQHQYILNQLVDAESIVLITDIQDSETLLNQLFAVCFDIVSGSGKNPSGVELAKSVEFQIQALLTAVVDEASLPQDAIDIVLSQFLRVDPRSSQQTSNRKKGADAKDKTQSTLLVKEYFPAYQMAKAICAACAEKMSAAISQYFSSIITNASAAMRDDGGKGKPSRIAADDDSDDDDHEAYNDLRKAHRLARELWRACPDVLTNVIPQLEVELAADSVSLRTLAVETLGDMIAGIGLAGLPDLPALDPAAFPLPSIEDEQPNSLPDNPVQKPLSPKPFIHIHVTAFQAFVGRRIDKAPSVRSAWVTAASRILLTQAGGIGLNSEEQTTLVSSLAKLLKDVDEKVRLSALQSFELHPYSTVIDVLGSDGGLSEPNSLLSTIAERTTDKKHVVRERAMLLLGSMWGVASRDLADGQDRVRSVLAQAPSRLLAAMYVKDTHVSSMLSKVLYECLLPLNYPPSKGKALAAKSLSQVENLKTSTDPDAIRVQRLLCLVRDLDDKAKPVFFGMQKRQADMAKAVNIFLQACEEYNGGVLDDSDTEKRLEEQLDRYIDSLSRQQYEPARAAADLWKFAKAHDRRNYQLVRFAMGAEHDFRTMTKAIKELTNRLRESSSGTMVDTLSSMLYHCALISYNRSHIPAIMEYARSAESGFAETAQEVLREISEKVPEVMKTHIRVLCKELEDAAPSDKQTESATAGDSLKACSAFAKRFAEEVPKDRKFLTAMMAYALYSSSPKAAKHAASIILITTDKKELRAKEILSKAIKRFNSTATNKAAQLAAIAQVCLLVPQAATAEEDEILKITMTNTLHKNESPIEGEYVEQAWSDDVDEETAAKQLALKVLVNRCRAGDDKSSRDAFDALANPLIKILMNLVQNQGEIAPTADTPSIQRNHLRLAAARLLVKLCRHKPRCEELITPAMFEKISLILIQPPYPVRRGLINQTKKYLNQNKLNNRWLTMSFLLAFEPDKEFRTSTMGWLKSRSVFYAKHQTQARAADKKAPAQNVMEITFARLLSMLTHHPDFPPKGSETYDGDLLDLAKYIVFYLQAVANDDNLSLIFHVSQRVKQAQDALSDDAEVQERLYVLSDLAQATIRNYADLMPSHAKGMNLLQTWPGKVHLSPTLFQPINGHAKAQEISTKNYLPEDVALGLEQLVRKMVRHSKQSANPRTKAATTPTADKKRKSSMSVDFDEDEADEGRKSVKKKAKKSTGLPVRKTPNSKKRKSEPLSVEQPSRKSVRASTGRSVNYVESDDDEQEEDTENIIKYKPAPMSRSAKRSKELSNVEENDDQDEDMQEEKEQRHAQASSPTPHGKDVEEEQDDEEEAEPEQADEVKDIEMTNGDGHDEEEEAVEDNNVNGNEHEEEQEATEEAEEEDDAEAEVTPPPVRTNSRRSAQRGATSDTAKSKASNKKVASVSKAQKTTKTKTKMRAPIRSKKGAAVTEEEKRSSHAPEPAPEPAATRRSARRSKA